VEQSHKSKQEISEKYQLQINEKHNQFLQTGQQLEQKEQHLNQFKQKQQELEQTVGDKLNEINSLKSKGFSTRKRIGKRKIRKIGSSKPSGEKQTKDETMQKSSSLTQELGNEKKQTSELKTKVADLEIV